MENHFPNVAILQYLSKELYFFLRYEQKKHHHFLPHFPTKSADFVVAIAHAFLNELNVATRQ